MKTISERQYSYESVPHPSSATLLPLDDAGHAVNEPMAVIVEQRSLDRYAIRHEVPLTVRRALLTLHGSSESVEVRLGATRFRRKGEYETVAWEPLWRRSQTWRQGVRATAS